MRICSRSVAFDSCLESAKESDPGKVDSPDRLALFVTVIPIIVSTATASQQTY